MLLVLCQRTNVLLQLVYCKVQWAKSILARMAVHTLRLITLYQHSLKCLFCAACKKSGYNHLPFMVLLTVLPDFQDVIALGRRSRGDGKRRWMSLRLSRA